MRCPVCAADNPEGSRFCSACGKEISVQPMPQVGVDLFPPPGPEIPQEAADNPPRFAGSDGSGSPEVSPGPYGGVFAEPQMPEMAPGFKEVELCAVCSGAFPIGDLLDFHGKLYCPLCKAREIKEGQKKEERVSKGLQPPPVIPPPQEEDPEPPPGEQADQPHGDQFRENRAAIVSVHRQSKQAGSGTYILVAVVMFGLLATVLSIVGVVLLNNPISGTSSPMMVPDTEDIRRPAAKPDEGARVSPAKPAKPEPAKPAKPDPAKPDPNEIVSYQPRWFTGTYFGANNDPKLIEKGVPENCLIFISEENQPVYISGLPDLYNIGKKYRFKFKPTKGYFENNVISADNLDLHPMEDDQSQAGVKKPDDKKQIYPRKNVILILDDQGEIHGDIIGDDGENYIIKTKDVRGEFSIPKSKVKKIE